MSQALTSSQPNRGTTPIQQLSQHKRSLSFNHHLSYNQYSLQGPNGRVASSSNQVVTREKSDQVPVGRVSSNNVKGNSTHIWVLRQNLPDLFKKIELNNCCSQLEYREFETSATITTNIVKFDGKWWSHVVQFTKTTAHLWRRCFSFARHWSVLCCLSKSL